MKRWYIVFLAAVFLLGMSVVIGYRVGVRLLQERIVEALGPGSGITEVKVNWFSLDVFGVSIAAPKDWPTGRTFRAARVTNNSESTNSLDRSDPYFFHRF